MQKDYYIQSLMDEVYDEYDVLLDDRIKNIKKARETNPNITNREITEQFGEAYTRNDVLKRFSPKHQAAVTLGHLYNQVANGGFYQWDDNGFSENKHILLDIAMIGNNLGIMYFDKLSKIFELVNKIPEYERNMVFNEDVCPECDGFGVDDEGDECRCCAGTGVVEYEDFEDNNEMRARMWDKLDTMYEMLNSNDELLLLFDEFLSRYDEWKDNENVQHWLT